MVLNRKCHDDPVSGRMSFHFQLLPQSRKFFFLPKSELDKAFPPPQFTNSSTGHRTVEIRAADYRVKTLTSVPGPLMQRRGTKRKS